jgi:16S rRNA (guanine527-N7)-methyltransferase
MERSDFIRLLSDALAANELADMVDVDCVNNLYLLTEHMLRVNNVMNLTRITEPREIILRHYIDSLTLLPHIPQGATVMDVGCGAGFPSLPLAIARPDLRITALDSTDKKVRYVNETASLLGISDRLTAITARAEDAAAPNSPLREHFDIVCSRAVARLPILAEITLPFLSVGGTLIAMKGGQAALEADEAAKAFSILGAEPARTLHCALRSPISFGDDFLQTDDHALVIARKGRKSPPIYPRKYAQICKKPL